KQTMTTTHSRTSRRALRIAGVGLAALAISAGGCRGDRSAKPPRQFFPDLDDQPKMKAQTKNTVWSEFEGKSTETDWGRSARLPVANTVPFGREMHAGPIRGYRTIDGNPVEHTV